MAFEIPGFLYSLEAAADLSAGQHHCVAIDSSSQLALAGDGVAISGVLQNKPGAQGRAGTVMRNGITKAVAGAAVTAGVAVACNASGRVIAAVSGKVVIGEAIDAAAADGETISVLLGGTHVLP